jgi:hypothetical protein
LVFRGTLLPLVMERGMHTFAAVDDLTPLHQLLDRVARPVTYHGRRVRALRSHRTAKDLTKMGLASSIISMSKNPGSNGTRPRADSDVTAQHDKMLVIFGKRL